MRWARREVLLLSAVEVAGCSCRDAAPDPWPAPPMTPGPRWMRYWLDGPRELVLLVMGGLFSRERERVVGWRERTKVAGLDDLHSPTPSPRSTPIPGT